MKYLNVFAHPGGGSTGGGNEGEVNKTRGRNVSKASKTAKKVASTKKKPRGRNVG